MSGFLSSNKSRRDDGVVLDATALDQLYTGTARSLLEMIHLDTT